MNSSLLISVVLIFMGCMLMMVGINAVNSIGSMHVSKFFTGRSTGRVICTLIGGIGLISAGFSGILLGQP